MHKERFALVDTGADLPIATFPCPWNDAFRIAVPPGLAFFKAEKSFSHGGAALQELIIPHLISKSRVTREKRIGVEVILPAAELTQTLVKVVLRPQVRTEAQGQLQLFAETGRTLTLDVVRTGAVRSSVLANRPKEVRLEPKPTGQTGEQAGEQSVTLFFQSSATFRKGEVLELEVRDVETGEAFPQGGSGLTVGRDM